MARERKRRVDWFRVCVPIKGSYSGTCLHLGMVPRERERERERERKRSSEKKPCNDQVLITRIQRETVGERRGIDISVIKSHVTFKYPSLERFRGTKREEREKSS